MIKKILIILIILFFLGAVTLIYLNSVFLPTKIKSAIINGLKENTQKEVTLQALSFSIFKGLVLRNLVIADKEAAIVKIKEASCGFLIFPIFKKTLIIPAIKIKSAAVFLQRRKDKTFNLQELFAKKTIETKKPKFNIFVRKLSIRDGSLRFQDDTLKQPFSKNMEDIDLNLYLSLPDKVKFNFDSEIAAEPTIKIKASGEYRITKKELSAKIYLRDLSPKEFTAYYENSGILIPRGRIDSQAEINYTPENKKLDFSGTATLINIAVKGIKFVDEIDEVNAEATFDNSGISCDGLNATVWGMPLKAKVSLDDFGNPLFKAEVGCALGLASLQDILKDKFKFDLGGELNGEAKLYLNLQGKMRSPQPLQLNGYLDVAGGVLKLKKLENPFKDISGRIEFTAQKLSWPVLSFAYLDTPYRSAGSLTNFKTPAVQFSLLSKNFALESEFAVADKVIRFSKFAGQYFNSPFSIIASINLAKPPEVYADLEGKLKLDLNDAKLFFSKSAAQIEKLKPSGNVQAKFNLSGDINKFKDCAIAAQLSSDSISLYGLKSQEFFLDYKQAGGLAVIPLLRLSLYDGTLSAKAEMELLPQNLPYRIEVNLENLKLEKLKADTPAKDKDIAGTILAQAKLNGEFQDISKLNGAGEIFISEGKLWQLNLFKGLGALVFIRDFGNIVFEQGSCSFIVQDKYIFSENVKLLSNIAELNGAAKLDFDGNIDSTINLKIKDEAIPISGTFKDIATIVLGSAEKFGTIKITGKLNDAKYKFQPSVVDIIKGIKDTFFKKKQ